MYRRLRNGNISGKKLLHYACPRYSVSIVHRSLSRKRCNSLDYSSSNYISGSSLTIDFDKIVPVINFKRAYRNIVLDRLEL